MYNKLWNKSLFAYGKISSHLINRDFKLIQQRQIYYLSNSSISKKSFLKANSSYSLSYTTKSFFSSADGSGKTENKSYRWLIGVTVAILIEELTRQIILPRYFERNNGSNNTQRKASESFPDYLNRLHQAAEKGDSEALKELGSMYHRGQGVPQNYKKAFELFEKAVEKGDIEAHAMLGLLYFYGEGTTQNHEKALKLIEIAAENDHTHGQYILGNIYFSRRKDAQDYEKAIKWFEKTAENQEYIETKNAESSLGIMYLEGRGTPKDPKKAYQWFEKAAVKGNCEAQAFLGFMFYQGEGAPKDYRKAVEWYQKAAENKSEYLVDKKKGELFRKKVENGLREAQYALGNMYFKGEGVDKDSIKAAEWYQKAANSGHKKAQEWLKKHSGGK